MHDASKRVSWTIEDVIQGRDFDVSEKFLPDGLTRMEALSFLD